MVNSWKFAVVTAIIVLCLTGISAPVQGSGDDEDQLRHLKTVLWPKAYAEGDVDLLDTILADEFRMIDAEGHWSSKADELEWVSKNQTENDSFEYQIERLEIFENGTAIVAGTGVIENTDDDGPYTVEYESTNVLIKRDDAWKAIASHVSGIRRTP